eukprot:317044-Pyramimonas_sp.AAC.1
MEIRSPALLELLGSLQVARDPKLGLVHAVNVQGQERVLIGPRLWMRLAPARLLAHAVQARAHGAAPECRADVLNMRLFSGNLHFRCHGQPLCLRVSRA